MAWLYPSFLWALFVLAIPIVIHLFNFRRYKKILFPNLRMLQQIDHQTKSGNKIKKYLILAARLLAFTFLVFAFAQPVLLRDKQVLKGGKKHISILIDNSLSMNLNGDEGPLLEAAKNRARAIVNASGNGDEFNLVTANMDATLLHFSGKQATLEHIDQLQISPNTYPLQNLLALQNSSLMSQPGDKLAFCISDFQQKNVQLSSMPIDSNIQQTWIRIPSETRDNLSIDSCFLRSPILQTAQPITLVARVSNYTPNAIEGSTLELYVDGKPKGVASFNIPAWSSATQDLIFTLESGGKHRCELRLPGDNIALDDVLYFSLRLNQQYRVANICADNERYIRNVFSDNPGFTYKQENSGSINFSDFKNRDLLVLQGIGDIQSGLISELRKFTQNGGTVLLFPAAGLPFGGLQNLSAAFGFSISEQPQQGPVRVSSIDLEHPVFKHIFENKPSKPDLPVVSQYFALRFSSGIPFMRLATTGAFMHDLPLGRGHMIVSAVPLDPAYSNFQNHALFVPVALRSAMLASYRNPLYYDCSDAGDIYTGLPFESESGLQLQDRKTSFIPEVINKDGELFLNTNGEISQAGHYSLLNKRADTAIADLSFNSSRSESDTRTLSEAAFKTLCERYGIESYEGPSEKLASELGKVQKGTVLWKWCILFSLLCLLIEILLIRFFRNHVRLSA